jgi:hypothetical protein
MDCKNCGKELPLKIGKSKGRKREFCHKLCRFAYYKKLHKSAPESDKNGSENSNISESNLSGNLELPKF